MAAEFNQWAKTPGVVDGKGSNSWVVAGNRTESGKPLFIEQINPANANEYRVPASGTVPAWAAFRVREEAIRVKGQPDVKLAVRESRHGPVLSDVQKTHTVLIDTKKYVIALKWAALEDDNQTVLVGLRANEAQSVSGGYSGATGLERSRRLNAGLCCGATCIRCVGR
jgi:acyl-homoserine lactone acylase PvdQ